MATMNNDKNHTYTRITRASKRGRTTTTTDEADEMIVTAEGVKQKSTVTKSKETSAVDSTSTPRKRTKRNITETEPSSKRSSREDAPQNAKAPSNDEQLQPERRAVGEPTVERTTLPTGTATSPHGVNHPIYGRIWVEPPEQEDPDEVTLTQAIHDLNDSYLRMVLQVLLRQHKKEKEDLKRLKRLAFYQNKPAPIIPQPSAAAIQYQAVKFVEEVTDENCKNYPVAQIHVTGQSVISEITDRNDYVEKYQRQCLSHHRLMECEEDVGYTVRESNGKSRKGTRRARGICRNCKRKTKWFCPTCPGTHGAKRAWFCHKRNNPVCQEAHLEKMELAFHDEQY